MVLTLPTSTLPVFLNIEGGWLSGGEPVLILVFLSAIWCAAFWLVFTAVFCNMNFLFKNDVLGCFSGGSWVSASLLRNPSTILNARGLLHPWLDSSISQGAGVW